MFLSHFYSLKYSARFYSANFEGRAALGMYLVEKGALLFVCRPLPNCHGEVLGYKVQPSSSHPVLICLDDSGTADRSGLLPLQSGIQTPAMLARYENHRILYEREVQETKAVKGRTITFVMSKRKHTASLAALTTAFKCQIPVEVGCSSEAFHSLLPTVPKEEDILGTAVASAQMELSKTARSAFARLWM